MSQLTIQCPNCWVNHPVPSLPPPGSALRCNRCGNTFVTPGAAPLGHLSGAHPQPQLGRRVLEPTKPATAVEPWMIAAGGAGFAVVVLLVAIGVSSLMNSGAPTPPVATNTPPVAGSPAVHSTVPPLANSAVPLSSSPALSTSAGSPAVAPLATASRSDSERIRQLKTVQTSPQYVYKWEADKKYRYGFELRTEANATEGPGGKVGVVEYQVGGIPGLAGQNGKQQASGTAFVIHSEGLLMTCNHVVAGASSLKVHLNKKVYPADVLAVDKANDLAIIRIQATGLTPLPLGNSEQVKLAEDVKAFGYPLSDVLGRNIKITSGTIAGRIDDAEGPRLQVDITINPGNSGGPLVNSRGEVVGINSAGLFGNSIQEVSFAVPSNLGRKLLGTLDVQGNGVAGSVALPGTELAEKVAPSTAFVEVELGAESAVMLQFTGSSKSIGSNTSPAQQLSSMVAVGLSGEVLGAQEDAAVGLGLGTFGTMVFEKLPDSGQTKWEEKTVTPISIGGGPGSGRSVGNLVIEQQVNYSLQSVTDTEIVIEKRVSCRTVGEATSIGTLRITGNGTWTFDRTEGVPKQMEMKVESYVSVAGKSTQSQGKVRYERLDTDSPNAWQTELEKDLAAVDGAAQSDASGMPKLPALPALVLEDTTEAQVATILRNLRGKKRSSTDYLPPLELLGRLKPIEKRRDDVSNALHQVRTQIPSYATGVWVRAARAWGTSRNVPTLMLILDSPASSTADQAMAIDALGRLPATPEGAELLTRHLGDNSLGLAAAQALVAMGAVAEEPIGALLTELQPARVRMISCVLLAQIGSRKSTTVLENYLRAESDRECRVIAQVALESVRARAAQQKPAGSKEKSGKADPPS
jgi:S1-C subfamily serine protease